MALVALVATLTVGGWLPVPLPGRTAQRGVPPTVAREVGISVESILDRAPPGSVRSLDGGRVRVLRTVTSVPAVACSPVRFTALGLAWQQRGPATVSAVVQAGPDRTRFGAGVAVEQQHGPDPTSPEYRAGIGATELVWVGDARCARFTLTVPAGVEVSRLRAVFINTSGTASGAPPSGGPAPSGGLLGAAPAEARARRPGMIWRSDWGADESLRNCGPSYADEVRMAFVHHTANANGYSWAEADDLVRAIYWYHTQTLGWCDIAYNFLVDRFGRIYEGRAGGVTEPVISAATRGFNTGSVSVAALGNYEVTGAPSAMVRAIWRVLAWRLDVAHVNPLGRVRMLSRGGSTGGKYPDGAVVRFRTIAAHRDAGYTACPGDFLYARLGAIRQAAYDRGLPKIFWPRQSVASFVPRQESVRWTARASGKLTWRLRVRNDQGQNVRSWTRRGDRFDLTWPGWLGGGRGPAPPGEYSVVLSGWQGDRPARAASFTLTLEPEPSPSPSPSP